MSNHVSVALLQHMLPGWQQAGSFLIFVFMAILFAPNP
jgi:hypothetical protein